MIKKTPGEKNVREKFIATLMVLKAHGVITPENFRYQTISITIQHYNL